MEAATLTQLNQYGAVGVLALCALYVCKELWRKFQEAQDGRLADSREYAAQMKELVVSTLTALTETKAAIDTTNNTLRSLAVTAEEETPTETAPQPPPPPTHPAPPAPADRPRKGNRP